MCNNGEITGKFSGPSFIVQAAKRRPLLLGNMKIYLLSVIAKNGEKTKSRCGIARAISHLLKGVAPQIRCYSARSSTRKSGSAAWSANDLRGFSKNADVSILFHPRWDFKTKRSALMRRSAWRFFVFVNIGHNAYSSGNISRELGLRSSCFLHIILSVGLKTLYQNVFLAFYLKFLCFNHSEYSL